MAVQRIAQRPGGAGQRFVEVRALDAAQRGQRVAGLIKGARFVAFGGQRFVLTQIVLRRDSQRLRRGHGVAQGRQPLLADFGLDQFGGGQVVRQLRWPGARVSSSFAFSPL